MCPSVAVSLYDGIAVGQGRLGPFLVIGDDGCGGVVFPALDYVESPDVETGGREFAGEVGQGSGLVWQLYQYSIVRYCFEASFVEDGTGRGPSGRW